MSVNFKNLSACQPCDNWNSGDGEGSVGWTACMYNGDTYLQPSLSGGGGYESISSIQNAMTPDPNNPNKILYQPGSSCMTNYNGYDDDSNDCKKCFNSTPVFPSENYQPYPWSRPKNYNNLNTCWTVQKPYSLS